MHTSHFSQCEPTGSISMNAEAAERMGLGHLNATQLRLISAMVLAKPVSPCEAACTLLGIPMITMSATVHYVNTSPPDGRIIKLGYRAGTALIPPVDLYVNRHASLEALTLPEFFRTHVVQSSKKNAPAKHTFINADTFGNMVRFRCLSNRSMYVVLRIVASVGVPFAQPAVCAIF